LNDVSDVAIRTPKGFYDLAHLWRSFCQVGGTVFSGCELPTVLKPTSY